MIKFKIMIIIKFTKKFLNKNNLMLNNMNSNQKT